MFAVGNAFRNGLDKGAIMTQGNATAVRSTHTRGAPASRGLHRLWLFTVGVAVALFALAMAASDAPAQTTDDLSFAPNVGQTDDDVRYVAQGAGYSFFFTDDKAVLSFAKDAGAGLALDLRFLGANTDATLEARDRAPGTVNYLVGSDSDPATDVPTFNKLVYHDLWPQIDMVFRGEDGTLKYEFHVAPGADPSDIRLAYAGADDLSPEPDGSLAVETAIGELNDAQPVSYQDVDGARVPLESRYVLEPGDQSAYGFAVGSDFDRGHPVIIDPGIAYSTFVGGTAADSGRAIAVDDHGNAYVTGQTASADYPTTPGAFDGSVQNTDAFVTKFDRAGSGIVYSTFVGGFAFDSGKGIAVDDDGAAYIAGFTGSTNFPTTPGAFDPTHNGFTDAFVTKLNPSGSALEYSSYLGAGGFASDGANGVAVDDQGSAYVTGFAGANDFPTTPGAFDQSHNGRNDVYVTKFNPSGSALAYSTFIGGSQLDTGSAIAIDRDGEAYVTGLTASESFPTTTGAFDGSHNGGGNDAFVAKLDKTGSTLAYSTFLGGTGSDSGAGIAVDDRSRSAHVTGSTSSSDYPTTGPGRVHDTSYGGNGDAFVTKLTGSGSALAYSSYLGGTGNDAGTAIAVASQGNAAHVTGSTASADFPITPGAVDPSHNGGDDAFMATFVRSGAALAYSTFLGGAAADVGEAIAVDEKAKVAYVTGSTQSGDYPTTVGAFDTMFAGSGDAFVTKLATRP